MHSKAVFQDLHLCAPCLKSILKILNTIYWGISSAGRASRWHREGRGFDSPILHELCRVLFVNALIVTKYIS